MQAGFSPEQRIFLRRHAMHAKGSRFRSFPALVFNSLQGGFGSFFSSFVLLPRSLPSRGPPLLSPKSSPYPPSRAPAARLLVGLASSEPPLTLTFPPACPAGPLLKLARGAPGKDVMEARWSPCRELMELRWSGCDVGVRPGRLYASDVLSNFDSPSIPLSGNPLYAKEKSANWGLLWTSSSGGVTSELFRPSRLLSIINRSSSRGSLCIGAVVSPTVFW